MSVCSSFCGSPSAIVALNNVKCTVKSGYSWVTSMNTSPTAGVTTSYYWHSRIRACSFVSPNSTLLLTNSQRSPLALCAGRWQIMNLSPCHMRAATTSIITVKRSQRSVSIRLVSTPLSNTISALYLSKISTNPCKAHCFYF